MCMSITGLEVMPLENKIGKISDSEQSILTYSVDNSTFKRLDWFVLPSSESQWDGAPVRTLVSTKIFCIRVKLREHQVLVIM